MGCFSIRHSLLAIRECVGGDDGRQPSRSAPRTLNPAALGQRGLAIMEFCKQFNAQTQKMEKGSPIPVVITVYQDRYFTFEMKTPPVSHFIKKAAKIESG